jgi:hypothetical protein
VIEQTPAKILGCGLAKTGSAPKALRCATNYRLIALLRNDSSLTRMTDACLPAPLTPNLGS